MRSTHPICSTGGCRSELYAFWRGNQDVEAHSQVPSSANTSVVLYHQMPPIAKPHLAAEPFQL